MFVIRYGRHLVWRELEKRPDLLLLFKEVASILSGLVRGRVQVYLGHAIEEKGFQHLLEKGEEAVKQLDEVIKEYSIEGEIERDFPEVYRKGRRYFDRYELSSSIPLRVACELLTHILIVDYLLEIYGKKGLTHLLANTLKNYERVGRLISKFRKTLRPETEKKIRREYAHLVDVMLRDALEEFYKRIEGG